MLKELIKYIRSMINMSQEQFAKEIGVSSVIVDQWESGKKYPSLTAQEQLYEICKNQCENTFFIQTVNDLDDIISKIKKEGALYHASRKGIEGKIQPTSRSKCDFGRGFYMGTDPLQPLTLVCNEEKPMFYTLEFNVQELKCLDMKIGIDWAMMIAYFRGYLEEYTEYSLSELELMVLKDKSIIRRKEGVSLANQIVRQHRRDGRFFDEILKGVEG